MSQMSIRKDDRLGKPGEQTGATRKASGFDMLEGLRPASPGVSTGGVCWE